MSEVRMCDVCGTVFSIRDTDWQTLTMRSNNPTDPMYGKTVAIDVCGKCGFAPPQPQLKSPSDDTLFAVKATTREVTDN